MWIQLRLLGFVVFFSTKPYNLQDVSVEEGMKGTQWNVFFFFLATHETKSSMPKYADNHNLVGGFNPSETYEFVSWDYSSQYMESHNPATFQTTNQS